MTHRLIRHDVARVRILAAAAARKLRLAREIRGREGSRRGERSERRHERAQARAAHGQGQSLALRCARPCRAAYLRAAHQLRAAGAPPCGPTSATAAAEEEPSRLTRAGRQALPPRRAWPWPAPPRAGRSRSSGCRGRATSRRPLGRQARGATTPSKRSSRAACAAQLNRIRAVDPSRSTLRVHPLCVSVHPRPGPQLAP